MTAAFHVPTGVVVVEKEMHDRGTCERAPATQNVTLW